MSIILDEKQTRIITMIYRLCNFFAMQYFDYRNHTIMAITRRKRKKDGSFRHTLTRLIISIIIL